MHAAVNACQLQVSHEVVGRPVLSRMKSIFEVPKNFSSAVATEAAVQECAAGYSGWFGVGTTGAQAASAVVAVLPSVCASCIALVGRQKSWKYFDSKQASTASACTTQIIAINRAFSTVLRPSLTNRRRLRGQKRGGGSVLNRARSVCYAVRTVLAAEP